jgi:hypothetical protein
VGRTKHPCTTIFIDGQEIGFDIYQDHRIILQTMSILVLVCPSSYPERPFLLVQSDQGVQLTLTAIYCRDYKFLQLCLHSRLHLCWIKHNVPYIFLPHLYTLVLQRLKFPLLVYPPSPLCRRFETQWPFICSPGYDCDTAFSVSERCRGTQWGRFESCFWLSLSSVTVSSYSVAQFKGRTNM